MPTMTNHLHDCKGLLAELVSLFCFDLMRCCIYLSYSVTSLMAGLSSPFFLMHLNASSVNAWISSLLPWLSTTSSTICNMQFSSIDKTKQSTKFSSMPIYVQKVKLQFWSYFEYKLIFDISWQTPIILKQRCKKIKKLTKKLRERERERTFFVRENYAKNGRENAKFIVKGCE